MLREIKRTIIEHEGGAAYTDVVGDAGGETKYGISKRYHPNVDIEHLTLDGAVKIAVEEYWKPMNLDSIDSPRIRWKLFDLAFGPYRGTLGAAIWLQRVLGVTQDGHIGKETLAALKKADEDSVLFGLMKEQQLYSAMQVERFPEKAKFIRGWIKRSHDLGQGIENEPEEI